jgi:hypothetical protein
MRTLGIAAAVLLLAGCSAAPPAPEPTPDPISIPTTCEQVMDINSLAYNVQIAYSQERLSGQEYQGAVAALKRLIPAVDVERGSELAVAVAALGDTMTDVNSDQYRAAVASVGDLCIAGGFPNYGILLWTGG